MEIGGLLRRDGARLLTLTGPAGVGKTRLAVEVGRHLSGEFARGVAFVDLSPVRDPSQVPPAVAASVGLHDAESPGLPEWLFAYLKERECLIVLHNFEQVTPAAPWIAELLAECSAVTLLVTSREALRLRWEQTYKVGPLEVPDPEHLPPTEDLARVPAVALFVERARAIDPGFALGEGNARAVAAAGEDGEQTDPEGVLDGLASLVDKSLVQAEKGDQEDVRYRLLESVREYALEQLETRDEAAAPRRAHALHFLELVERAGPELVGRYQRALFLRIEQEHDNLRSALRWVSSEGEYGLALRLAAALGYFWWLRGYYTEGRPFLGELVGRAPAGAADCRTRALALSWLGVLLVFQGEAGRARPILEDGLAAARSSADPRTVTVSLLCLALHARLSGQWERGAPLLEEALEPSRRAGDAWCAARTLNDLGINALYAGDHAGAERLLEEAHAGYHSIGDERSTAEALLWLGMAVKERGEMPRAVDLVRQALIMNRTLQDRRLFTIGGGAVLWLGGGTAGSQP